MGTPFHCPTMPLNASAFFAWLFMQATWHTEAPLVNQQELALLAPAQDRFPLADWRSFPPPVCDVKHFDLLSCACSFRCPVDKETAWMMGLVIIHSTWDPQSRKKCRQTKVALTKHRIRSRMHQWWASDQPAWVDKWHLLAQRMWVVAHQATWRTLKRFPVRALSHESTKGCKDPLWQNLKTSVPSKPRIIKQMHQNNLWWRTFLFHWGQCIP